MRISIPCFGCLKNSFACLFFIILICVVFLIKQLFYAKCQSNTLLLILSCIKIKDYMYIYMFILTKLTCGEKMLIGHGS